MGLGLIALLVPAVSAGNVDSKVERLERLERALQIEDCQYAVQELEHLNVSYSNMAFRYGLLAEGYLCIGKPEKARLSVQEFARLGGEANQLSMRVQEFCALQECALEPVLVKPVLQQSTMAEEVETIPDVRIEAEPPEGKAVAPVVITETPLVTAPIKMSERPIPEEVQKSVADPITEKLGTEKLGKPAEIDDVRLAPAAPVSEHSTPYTVSEINAMVVDGQCADAAVAGANLVAIEPENAFGYMAFGDALACYPEGSGDVFAAFDAWMLAKSLAKTQQLDWQPMKERLGWALERSGIVKVVPEFEEGYTQWPEGFSISLETSRAVDLAPRTDHMRGGTYLTNLPEGKATIRITPGGARPDVLKEITIRAGELQKIRVPIGAEKHIRLPILPVAEGYTLTLVGSDDQSIVYNPNEETLLPKDTYRATVEYREQVYEFQADLSASNLGQGEGTLQQTFRDLLPWVYLIRDADGELLSDGLVYPDQVTTAVSVVLDETSYWNWRDGVEPEEQDVIRLTASGEVEELNESLFTEVVIDSEQHPFYETAEQLYALEGDLEATYNSTKWLTGTMLTAGVWTGVSLAMANGESDAGFWESQAFAGSMLTVPMVAIWMNEKMRVEPAQQRQGQRLYAMLTELNDFPVPMKDLIPSSDVLEAGDSDGEDDSIEYIYEYDAEDDVAGDDEDDAGSFEEGDVGAQ